MESLEIKDSTATKITDQAATTVAAIFEIANKISQIKSLSRTRDSKKVVTTTTTFAGVGAQRETTKKLNKAAA